MRILHRAPHAEVRILCDTRHLVGAGKRIASRYGEGELIPVAEHEPCERCEATSDSGQVWGLLVFAESDMNGTIKNLREFIGLIEEAITEAGGEV